MKTTQLFTYVLFVGAALSCTSLSHAFKFEIPDEYKEKAEAQKAAESAALEEELDQVASGEESASSVMTFDQPSLSVEEEAVNTEEGGLELADVPALEEEVATETFGDGQGRIAGQVFDKETGQPVRGVAIFIKDMELGTITDSQGRYRINNVPVGEYSLTFFKSDYIEATVTETRVVEGELMNLDFALPPRPVDMSDDVYVLTDFSVTAEEAVSQNVALLSLRKTSIASIDALSSEDFSKFAASDVAEAVTKVSGASLSDGKYLVFRGLNDRYNTVLINGVVLPSPDPDRKAIALDIFPTSLVENIVARKTYTSDMPGESSGGSVDLTTESIPDEFFAKLSVGVGGQLHSSDTKQFLSDPEQVSLLDWIKGDDRRGFNIVPGSSELVSDYPSQVGGVDFPRMAPNQGRLPKMGDRSYSFSTGGSKAFNEWLTVGAVLGLKVSEKKRTSFEETFKVRLDGGNAVLDEVAGPGLVDLGVLTSAEGSLNGEPFGGILKSEEEYTASVLFGLGAQISDHTSLNYTYFRSESLTSTAEQVEYYQFEENAPAVDGATEDNAFYKYLDFEIGSEERMLEAHQFSGEHVFDLLNFEEWTFSWYFTRANMEQSEPDQRIIGEWLPEFDSFAGDPGLPPATRLDRETTQKSTMKGLSLEQEFELFEDAVTLSLNFGYDSENSERDFRQLETNDFLDAEVDDLFYAGMPFPNVPGLNDVVDGNIELFYDAFVDENLEGGVNELVEALFEREVGVAEGKIVDAQNDFNGAQADLDAAQSGLGTLQTNLDASITAWEGLTGVDYETQFDVDNSMHVLFNDALLIPDQQDDVDVQQLVVDDAQEDLDDASVALGAAGDGLADIQGEQAAYQSGAAALIAQIATMPALATDPTAFPTFSFFGDQDYILETPRGFSIYADETPTISNTQFYSANGFFQARGENIVESFYLSGNLKFDKVPVFESIRVAGGFRNESTELSYDLLPNAFGEPPAASGDGGGVSPFVVDSSSIDQDDDLSYVSFIFEITENLKLCVSHSKTVAKPTFREIAPFPIFNLSDRSFEQGNAGLMLRSASGFDDWLDRTGDFDGKDDSDLPEKFVLPVEFAGLEIAEVESRDIRLEYFTPLDGLLAFGYFTKDVAAPIERIFAYEASGVDVNSFINNDNDADLSGFEIEVQQNLGILNDWFGETILPFDWITVGGNYTKLDAEVERSSYEKSILTNARADAGFVVPDVFQDGGANSKRPLYDQPSYVANAFVTFDIKKTGTKITLSQNWLGEQLDRAGGIAESSVGVADTYWDEFSSLNLVIEQQITENIKLKFAVKNLDSPVRTLYEDELFYDALIEDGLLDRDGGNELSDSAAGFDRRSSTVEPSYSISISGSF